MKISLLDYSAIRAANAAQANANSFKISVLGQQHNNLMTKANVIYTDKSAKMNERMQSVRESSAMMQMSMQRLKTNTENTLNLINAIGNTVKLGINTASTIIEYNTQKDTEAANSLLSDISTDYSIQLANDVANNSSSYIDSNGNVVKSPTLVKIEDSYRKMIEDADLGKNVKDKALSALNDMFNSAWGDIAADLISTNITARNDAWDLRLGEAVAEDSKTGVPALTNELIDNTGWLLPAEKEALKEQWEPQIKASYHANETSRIARTKGQPSANEYINNLIDSGEIDENEWLSLSALVNQVGGEEDDNAAQNAVQYASEQMQQGVFPSTINEQLKPQLELMDEERKDYVQSQLNKTYYDHALTEFQWPDNISSISGTQLRALQDDVNERGEALLPDMSVELNSLKATLQEEFDRRSEINADTNIDNLELIYEAAGTTLAPSAVAKQLMTIDVESTSDNADDQKLLELLGNMENRENFIPKTWKPLYNELSGNFESLLKSTYGLNTDNPEDTKRAASIKADAIGSFLDYFWYTAPEDISAEGIMDAYNKSVNIYFGENMQQLEELLEETQGRTLLQEGTAGSDATLLSKFSDIALNAPDGMIEQGENGAYEFPVPAYAQTWAEIMVLEKDVVGRYTGKDVSNWITTPYQRENADGSTTAVPLPVIQSPDGTRYTIKGNSLMVQNKEGGEWNAVLNLETYENPQGYQAPVSTDKPRNVLPDGDGGYIDETEISPEENNFLSYVASLENEPSKTAQPQQATVKETAAPVAHQEKEPTIPIRRVKNSGTQFWYQGNWYLVNDLTEGSDVLSAYDRFISRFNGRIPKVGY